MRLGLAIDQAAEQQVVLDRGGGVVASRVIEIDPASEIGRQRFGNRTPCLQQALLKCRINQIQAMPGLDIGKGHADQAAPIGRRDIGQTVFLQTADQLLIGGQLIGSDEAELLEEGMAGWQIGKEFDHGFGNLLAHMQQVLHQTFMLEQLDQERTVDQPRIVKAAACSRCPEQHVFDQAQILVVAVGIKRFDQAGKARLPQSIGDRPTTFQKLHRQVGIMIGVDKAPQAKLIDVTR